VLKEIINLKKKKSCNEHFFPLHKPQLLQ